ncbi:MAG: ester cyclase [Dehalococcoidia bacterium]
MSDAATIVKEFFEAFNNRDWDKMRSMLSSDFTYTGGDGVVQRGPDAGLAVAQMFATAMPDAKIEVTRMHSAGNVVVAEFTGTGTQTGNFMDVPPTGRKVTMPVCDVVEVRDGQIVAEREYMDMLHMMRQLGVVEAPATA